MAYQKLQVSRGLEVVTSNTVNIPNPAAVAVSGTAATPTGAQLVGTGTTFTKSVRVGDVVYAGASGGARTIVATITAVVSDTVLTTSTAVTNTFTYNIYSQATNPSNGCVLYVGVAGDVRLLTADGDDITLKTVGAGSFLPVQTLKVFATTTTATDIVALW